MLYEYYKDVQAAALRTYITAQLSYIILHLHESGNFRGQSIAYRDRFVQTNQQIRDAFQAKLGTANRDVWNCDPINYNGLLLFELLLLSLASVTTINVRYINVFRLQLQAQIVK